MSNETTTTAQILRELLDREAEAAKTGDAYLSTAEREAIERVAGGDLAVIAFQPEAWESAGTMLYRLEGWTVDVVPIEGEPFTATVGDVVYPDGGGFKIKLRVWVDDRPGDEVRTLDVYDEIVRLEVC